MNLLVKKLWLPVIVLLATVTLISCEDPGRIGLIINSDNGLLKTGYREIVLPSTVVQFEPGTTTGSSSLRAGQFNDPDFGLVDYKYYTQLNPSLVVDPSENATFEKFTLSIGFDNITGPTPENSQLTSIIINQLNEPIDSTATYIRTDELTVKQQLGVWQFAPLYIDTLRTDSTYIVDLDSDVGLDLFLKLKEGNEIFDSRARFNEYFNGISFEAGAEARHVFDIDNTRTRFTIHYTETNSEGNPIEREYTLSPSGYNFHHISADYSTTPLSGIVPNNKEFDPADGSRYMQSGTMVATRIDLSPFLDLSDTINYMVINKAVILLEDVSSASDYYRPPNDIITYFTDDTGEWPIIDYYGRVDSTRIGEFFVTLQDQSLNVAPGFYSLTQQTDYNADSTNYAINISSFLQNLYAGNYSSVAQPFVEEHGLVYLFTESSVLYPGRSVSHTAVTGFKVHKDNIKLRIYYSYPRNQQSE